MENETDINKAEFEAYENVRKSGQTNMFNVKAVEMLSGGYLTREKIFFIMKHYGDLMEKWPDVRGD